MTIFNPDKLLLIAGPCSLESYEISSSVAKTLKKIEQKYDNLNIVFKGSFDKANRTSLASNRGTGMEKGLEILAQIKKEFGFKVLTDIHLPEQANEIAKVCDVLQIPAFLCRQTDVLVAAANTGKCVNVKKGQFLSPYEMEFVVNKLKAVNAKEIWQTERGTFFGYQNLVVDMRSFSIMKEFSPVAIFDATHSVQLPGKANGQSGGEKQYVSLLAKSALSAGANGLFIETHPNPQKAISDAQTQLSTSELEEFFDEYYAK